MTLIDVHAFRTRKSERGYFQSNSPSPTDSESTQSRNMIMCAQNANTCTKCQYEIVSLMVIQSYTTTHEQNDNTYPYYLRPVNAVLIILLIKYFTTYRVLLFTFVLSVINNIITTPQDAITDRNNHEQIPVSNDQSNRRNTGL